MPGRGEREPVTHPDAVTEMSRHVERILAGEDPYDVAVDASGVFELGRSELDFTAYMIWAEICDLREDPRRPGDEAALSVVANAVASAWADGPPATDAEVTRFIDAWNPSTGRRFRDAAGWKSRSRETLRAWWGRR